jgi:hypothetical protein
VQYTRSEYCECAFTARLLNCGSYIPFVSVFVISGKASDVSEGIQRRIHVQLNKTGDCREQNVVVKRASLLIEAFTRVINSLY